MNQKNYSEENKNIPQKKYIEVKYENTSKKFSYYGDLDVNEFKNQIKEMFNIEYPTDKFLFKTDDDEFLILNKNTPPFFEIILFINKDKIFVKNGLKNELSSGQKYEITIKTLTSKIMPIEVESSYTVRYLKEKIELENGIPVDQQVLYYREELEDTRTLAEYDIEEGSTVFLIYKYKE